MFISILLIANVLSFILANQISILTLPNEILFKVAERVPIQDVFRFGRVHSQLHRQLIKDFDVYLRKIYPNEKDLSQVLKIDNDGRTVVLKVNENILWQTEHTGFLVFNLIHSFEDFDLLLRYLSINKVLLKIDVLLDFEKLGSEERFKNALNILSGNNVNLISLRITKIASKEMCLLIPAFVSKKKTLRHISVTNCAVSCEVELIKSISESRSEITHVDLSDNNISNLDSEEFTRYLDNSKVESLDLSDNYIQRNTLLPIFSGPARNNLKRLSLRGIDHDGQNAINWWLIMDMVRFSNLHRVDFSSNLIHLSVDLIRFGFSFDVPLEHLDIAKSGIQVKDVAILMKAMPNLQYLNIKENDIEYNDEFYIALSKSKLKTLRLTQNRYLDDSLDKFSQSIIKSKLTLLEIEGDEDEPYKELKESFKQQRPNLKIVINKRNSGNGTDSDLEDFSLGLAILSLFWQRD